VIYTTNWAAEKEGEGRLEVGWRRRHGWGHLVDFLNTEIEADPEGKHLLRFLPPFSSMKKGMGGGKRAVPGGDLADRRQRQNCVRE